VIGASVSCADGTFAGTILKTN